jgi:hypothetical protein
MTGGCAALQAQEQLLCEERAAAALVAAEAMMPKWPPVVDRPEGGGSSSLSWSENPAAVLDSAESRRTALNAGELCCCP